MTNDDWIPDVRTRLAAARLDPARELEIAQELAQHLDDRYAELLRGGAGPDDARRLALDELKDHALMREQLRQVERLASALPPPGAPGAAPLQGLWSDVRYAWRRLLATPAFTIFSILTLALGIGATTAVYSAVYTAALRPPPLVDADRVVNLYHSDPRSGGASIFRFALSPPDIADFSAAQTSFAALTSWSRFRHALVAAGTSDVINGEMVSGDYFRVVGFSAALGRTLQPADDRPGMPRVMVLGDSLWRRRFGADPAVLGTPVNLGGDVFEIVGVMPPEFCGVDLPNLMPTEAWVPLSSTRSQNNDTMHDRERRWLFLKGRLKPGVTVASAQAEFGTIGRQLDLQHPSAGRRGRREARDGWFLMPAINVRMHESMDGMIAPMIAAIMVAVGLVLLVACTNIANLMVARGTSRRQEQAVRLALGASRWRLVRAQLVEACLVTAGGGVAAYVVARLVLAELLTATFQITPGFIVRFEPAFHSSVAAVAGASSVLALFTFGLVPALNASRCALRDALQSGGAGSMGAPRWRGRRSLIALQVAVSSGLVAVAVLCAQQVFASARRDSGMDLDRIALAQVDFGLLRQDEVHGRRVLEAALEQARRLPGVEKVAVSSGLPAGVSSPGARLLDHELGAELVAASPSLFQVLGIPIVAGRAFEANDGPGSYRVAVISRQLAAQLGGSEAVLNRSFAIQRQASINQPEPPSVVVTIVGIAEDTDVGVLGRRQGGVLYVPFAQHYEPGMVLVARAASDPRPLPARLRRILHEVEPDTAVIQAVIGSDLLGHDNNVLTVGAIGSGLLGTLALVLAMAGLYGVMADVVARRTREIGIRIALGADRARVLRMVLLDGIRPVVEGLLLGIGFGALLRMLFQPMFIRVLPAFDPMLLVVVPAAFLACALLAAYLPARRAANVDPNVALRAL